METNRFFADAALAALQLSFLIERGEWPSDKKGSNQSVSAMSDEVRRMALIGRMPYPSNKKDAKEFTWAMMWLNGIAARGKVATAQPVERLRRFAAIMLKMQDVKCVDWAHFRLPKYYKENK